MLGQPCDSLSALHGATAHSSTTDGTPDATARNMLTSGEGTVCHEGHILSPDKRTAGALRVGTSAGRAAGWPGDGEIVFVEVGIAERISLRYVSGKYRQAEARLGRLHNFPHGVQAQFP